MARFIYLILTLLVIPSFAIAQVQPVVEMGTNVGATLTNSTFGTQASIGIPGEGLTVLIDELNRDTPSSASLAPTSTTQVSHPCPEGWRRIEAPLRGQSNLSCADLFDVSLYEAYLPKADLSWSDLTDAYMVRADLSGANLEGAILIFADHRFAKLSRASLIAADLRGADLRGSDLTGVDLTRTRYNSATRFSDGFDPKL